MPPRIPLHLRQGPRRAKRKKCVAWPKPAIIIQARVSPLLPCFSTQRPPPQLNRSLKAEYHHPPLPKRHRSLWDRLLPAAPPPALSTASSAARCCRSTPKRWIAARKSPCSIQRFRNTCSPASRAAGNVQAGSESHAQVSPASGARSFQRDGLGAEWLLSRRAGSNAPDGAFIRRADPYSHLCLAEHLCRHQVARRYLSSRTSPPPDPHTRWHRL